MRQGFILEKIRKNEDFVGAGSPKFLLPTNNLKKPAPAHDIEILTAP